MSATVPTGFDPTDPDIYVEVDTTLMHQVLSNLLVNAKKFSPPGSRVVVNGREALDSVISREPGRGKGDGDWFTVTLPAGVNVGMSSDAEMTRLIEERRGQGTFLTVLGFRFAMEGPIVDPDPIFVAPRAEDWFVTLVRDRK